MFLFHVDGGSHVQYDRCRFEKIPYLGRTQNNDKINKTIISIKLYRVFIVWVLVWVNEVVLAGKLLFRDYSDISGNDKHTGWIRPKKKTDVHKQKCKDILSYNRLVNILYSLCFYYVYLNREYLSRIIVFCITCLSYAYGRTRIKWSNSKKMTKHSSW